MFTTVEDVKTRTGRDVTKEAIFKAQFIIEVYIARTENDISSIRDKELLGRMTIAQVVYMGDNYDQVYEQVAASASSNNGTLITYRAGDEVSPFIAPLAVMASKGLSWNNSKSIKVGRTLQSSGYVPWERD